MTETLSGAETVGDNPFYYLTPATPAEFVGRWPLVRDMAGELVAGRDSYACIGGRRFGKTSVLLALHDTLRQHPTVQTSRPVLPLLVDPMRDTFASADHFFATLLHEVRRRTDDRLPDPPGEPGHVRVALDGPQLDRFLSGAPPAITAAQFAEAMNSIFNRLDSVGGPRRLIVLLDEVDHLLDYPWHKDLFAQLRASLVSGDLAARLRLVLAGSRRFLEEATDRGSPLLNMLHRQYLTALDETSTYELIARAEGLPETVQRAVWQQSGGHPFLAQYLLHHLWKTGSIQMTERDVVGLANRFRHQEATHLEGWSKAIGLAGLQIYGLFIDAPGWLDRKAIVQAVSDPKVPVTGALSALCYHGLVVPNDMWSQYRRAGDLFREWYVQEVRRLIEALTPLGPNPAPDPRFWIQLISHGTLQAAFGDHNALASSGGRAEVVDQSHTTGIDQRGQRVGYQYNAAGDINFGAVQNRIDLVGELGKLQGEMTQARQAGVFDEGVATDAEYRLTKAVQEAKKPAPDKGTLLDHLTSAKTLVEGVAEAGGLVTALTKAAELVRQFF